VSGLPPRFVVAPIELVYPEQFGDWLSRAIADTGRKLWGLGWRHKYERSDPLDLQTLLEILGLGKSQFYEHLRVLTATGVLRYSNAGGRFTFHYLRPEEFKVGEGRGSPDFRTGVGNSVVVEDLPLNFSGDRIQQQHYSCIGGECEGGAAESGNPDRARIVALLVQAGVWEDVAEELAGYPWVTLGYVSGWLEWWQVRAPDGVELGLLVASMRKAREVPLEIRQWYEQRGLDVPRKYA
jgi:hypothetical protein